MEYVYAALILHETDAEINEDNLTTVLEAADVEVEESRVKALVAALEDVDIEEALEQAAATPTSATPPAGAAEEPESDDTEEDKAEAEADEEPEEEEEEVSGEGLGDLFG